LSKVDGGSALLHLANKDSPVVVGGHLGFFCAHAYPHTSVRHCPFPEMLRGLDMVIWETFVALGLDVEMHPV